MSRIKIYIMLLFSAVCLFSQSTETFNPIERRHTKYNFGSDAYAINFSSGPIVAGVDATYEDNYAGAATWNISELDDWGFITNSRFYCTSTDGPANTLSLECNTMETRPGLHTDLETFMDDVADGETYYSGDVTSSSLGYQYYENDYDSYLESRLDDSWVALGFHDGNFNESTETETDFADPTLKFEFEVRMSTSGTLSENERWGDEHTLTGNVTVPSGVTLKLWENLELNLKNGANEYYLEVESGGEIELESGVDFSPCEVTVTSGGTLKGYFPSIASALSYASSGEIVHIYSSITLSDDLEVPSGVTLMFESGTTTTLNGNKITTSTGSLYMNGGSVTPNIQRKNITGLRKGFYPTIASAISDASSGDDIYLDSESYTENVNMPGSAELHGAGRTATTINGDVTFDGVSSSRIVNMKVTGDITVEQFQTSEI